MNGGFTPFKEHEQKSLSETKMTVEDAVWFESVVIPMYRKRVQDVNKGPRSDDAKYQLCCQLKDSTRK